MQRPISLVVGLLLAVAGGSAPGAPATRAAASEPRARPPGVPLRPDTVSLLDYAHLRQGDDWAPALEQAAQDAGTVYVPAGSYELRRTAYLVRDGTRLYGDGPESRLVQKTPGQHVLEANQSAFGTEPDGIVVEDLGFAGPGSPWTFALVSVDGNGIRFRGNRIAGIGAFRSVHVAATPRRFASDVEVMDNTADGGEPRAGTFGVLLENTRDVRVGRNRIEAYDKGIQWWGGEADPAKPDFSAVPLAGQMVVEDNIVNNTVAAIWGSNGEEITVRGNRVADCQDVCLDAEGSRDVRFVGNEARFAGTAVLAVFHRAEGVTFEDNRVEQKGGFPERPEQPAGRALFASRNPSGRPAGISVRLRNNHFIYTGSDGAGVIRNQPLQRLEIVDNRLVNTVLDLRQGRGGEVRVVGNELWFEAGMPAPEPISVSRAAGGGAELARNRVRVGKPR